MLSPHSPVTGRDLAALRVALDLTVTDFLHVLGITMVKWTTLQKQYFDLAIPDPAMALWVRAVHQYPELLWIPQFPAANSVFTQLKATATARRETITPKTFATALGLDQTATHRLIQAGGRPGPFTKRALYALNQLLAEKGHDGWCGIRDIVDTEAQARGISDIWNRGKWSTDTEAGAPEEAA